MTRIKKGYVDAEWGQVHYRQCGESGPWFALFHECPLTSAVFDRALPLLGRHGRAVAFDMPGYGASDPPPNNRFEIPDYARVLAQAAVQIGVTRPILAGVHTGASIALEAATRWTGGAAGLALTGIALFSEEERAKFIANWTPPIPFDAQGSQFAWAVERYRKIWGPDLPADLLQIAVVELLRTGDRYDWGYQAAFRHDPAPSLKATELPILLIDAEFDILADKDPIAMEIAKDAQLIILKGLPGQPHLRAAEEYARHLLGFANRLVSSA